MELEVTKEIEDWLVPLVLEVRWVGPEKTEQKELLVPEESQAVRVCQEGQEAREQKVFKDGMAIKVSLVYQAVQVRSIVVLSDFKLFMFRIKFENQTI